jgi:cell wall-associated NlpC family hydrolase
MAKLDGIGAGAVGLGSLFAYAGLKGYSVPHAIQALVTGKAPSTGGQANPVGTPTGGGPAGGGSTSLGIIGGGASGLAAIAQSYVGKLTYVFGGPPPPGTVDCSSFASKCLNQAGVSSPGGSPYSASTHGPATVAYLTWGGATTVGHVASVAQPGDLCVWQTHMGICIGGGQMVSARDPAEGVGIDNIAGDMPGEFLFVRRLK